MIHKSIVPGGDDNSRGGQNPFLIEAFRRLGACDHRKDERDRRRRENDRRRQEAEMRAQQKSQHRMNRTPSRR